MTVKSFVFGDNFSYSGKKELGQFFTNELVTLFATSLSYACLGSPKKSLSVLDPTCGNGAMLWVGYKYLEETSKHAPFMSGVEVDKDVLPSLENLPFGIPRKNVDMFNDDFFTKSLILSSDKPNFPKYDLILGNPPYVRYQKLSTLLEYFPQQMISYFSKHYPKLEKSKVVIRILKCSLIGSFLGIDSYEEADLLLKGEASTKLSPVEKNWISLVRDIPGLADLSIYTWLQSYVYLKEDSRICFVAPNTWKSRDYGMVLKRFFRDFLTPEIVVSQKGKGWFGEAQVDAQIIICKKKKVKSQGKVKSIYIDSDFNLTDFKFWDDINLKKLDSLSQKIIKLKKNKEFKFGKVNIVTLDDYLGLPKDNVTKKEIIPYEIKDLICKHDGEIETSTFLDEGIEINQGLRTGCNSFFYLNKIKDINNKTIEVLTDEEVGSDTIKIEKKFLVPVIKKQSDLTDNETQKIAPQIFTLAIPRGYYRKADKIKSSVSKPIGGDLLKYIDKAELTSVSRNGKTSPIPELSAVKTNKTKGNEEKGVLAGCWFHLSIQKRHFGDLFIPRVNGKSISIGLNNASEKFLIDANFSTLTLLENSRFTDYALYAYLNSTLFKYFLECLGNSMGGGALKIEGSLLKKVPLLVFKSQELKKLDALGKSLTLDSNNSKLIAKIDDLCSSKIVKSKVSRKSFQKELLDVYLDSVCQRMNKGK